MDPHYEFSPIFFEPQVNLYLQPSLTHKFPADAHFPPDLLLRRLVLPSRHNDLLVLDRVPHRVYDLTHGNSRVLPAREA